MQCARICGASGAFLEQIAKLAWLVSAAANLRKTAQSSKVITFHYEVFTFHRRKCSVFKRCRQRISAADFTSISTTQLCR